VPLRILHITRDFPPNINGGLSVAVGGLVEAQARAGIECVVVSFDNYRPASGSVKREPERTTTISGITVIHVTGKAALERAQELAVNFIADVVHVHHELLWSFAKAVAQFNRSPTVLTIHVLQSEQNRLRDVATTQSSEAQARALAECSILHAPSQAVANILIESSLALGGRLKVVPLGCDDWPGAVEASEQERFGDWPMLLYVGRFADICGFAELLEALATLLSDDPTLQVTIAGGMPDNPRAEKRWKKRWDKLAGDEAARVHWAGWRSSDELSELYGAATMLVVPSWFETFGQVALEGMLHGTPLITTGAGALANLVDEECALLIDKKSPESIVAAVQSLLADPAAAEARRLAALRRVQSGYHWDDRMDAIREIYQAAMKS
tara:strand:- start:16518 stop:17666 length:1149 start_codon:yes stop_codon:yes gene_type:complete